MGPRECEHAKTQIGEEGEGDEEGEGERVCADSPRTKTKVGLARERVDLAGVRNSPIRLERGATGGAM